MARKTGRKLKLNRTLIKQIALRIKAGAFAHVAAGSVGIGVSTFYRWLAEGESEDAPPLFREFREAILQAQSAARQHAEMRVFKENPSTWLLRGPGREREDRPGEPGWGEKSVVSIEGHVQHDHDVVLRPAPLESLVEAFNILRQLGYTGFEAVDAADVIDVECTPVEHADGNGNGKTLVVQPLPPGPRSKKAHSTPRPFGNGPAAI